MSDLNLVYTAVQTISDLYESLDDDSQDSGERQLIFQTIIYAILWKFFVQLLSVGVLF